MAKQVIVTVTTTTSGGGTTYQVGLDNDPLDLTNEGNNAALTWRIGQSSAADWYFGIIGSGGGISITRPDPSGKFTSPANDSGPKPRAVNCTRSSADGLTYKYSISVTNGTTTLLVDPSIINQP